MTELAKHIEILLLNNDCVIVPGFGGFMAHPVSAVYDEEEHVFYPPTRTLGFNPQLKINDSLLAQSYVEAYDISYPEALRRIEDDVRELQQCLSSTGRYEMPDVGTIISDGEESYDFEPCVSGLLTPDLYAFSSFDISRLEGVKMVSEIPAEIVQEIPAPVASDILEVAENDNLEEDTAFNYIEEESSGARVISIRLDTLKKALATAAVAIFLILFSVPLGDKQQGELRMCSVDSDMLFRLMPRMEEKGTLPLFMLKNEAEESAPRQVTNVAENNEITPTTPKEDKVDVAQIDTEKVGNYVIVLVSAVPKVNAETYAKKLNNEGIADARVYVRKGSVKVVCGSYEDIETARKAHVELKSKFPSIKGGWYYRIK